MSTQLNFTLIQPNIVWEDKRANLRQYEDYISNVKEKKEIVVLPEMFSTGFSMAPERLAEQMDGDTVQWMKRMAKSHRCILTGSVIIEEEGKYYNRMLWVQPDGKVGHYDKRHLFAYASEDKHYNAGDSRLIVSVKGIRICLQVCYDLRFPVWSRNNKAVYDVLLYVANWPERRSMPWKALLQARAIENMSYVIGVNRVGEDGNGINHSGDSSVFSPLGEQLWQVSNKPICATITIDKQQIIEARERFPFLDDADNFMVAD
ncbi:MAG: amidohydrolase [Flavipsychrobacter sp.]